ncbi:hypothetical protein ONZ45_g9146 [Pleurotus djamor]|nr:hypothetical protein ONZ45_g9146 [Pleurotus djamor]
MLGDECLHLINTRSERRLRHLRHLRRIEYMPVDSNELVPDMIDGPTPSLGGLTAHASFSSLLDIEYHSQDHLADGARSMERITMNRRANGPYTRLLIGLFCVHHDRESSPCPSEVRNLKPKTQGRDSRTLCRWSTLPIASTLVQTDAHAIFERIGRVDSRVD